MTTDTPRRRRTPDRPHMKKDRHGHRKLTAFTLRLMGEIGGLIAAPVVVLSWLGRKADLLLETKPKVLVVSLLLSFVVSTVALCLRASDYGDQYELLTEQPADPAAAPKGDGGRDGPPSHRNYG